MLVYIEPLRAVAGLLQNLAKLSQDLTELTQDFPVEVRGRSGPGGVEGGGPLYPKNLAAPELAEGISMEKWWFCTRLSAFSKNRIRRVHPPAKIISEQIGVSSARETIF